MNFREIIVGDWDLLIDMMFNFLYSVWPIVIVPLAIGAFGFLLGIIIDAFMQFRRG